MVLIIKCNIDLIIHLLLTVIRLTKKINRQETGDDY